MRDLHNGGLWVDPRISRNSAIARVQAIAPEPAGRGPADNRAAKQAAAYTALIQKQMQSVLGTERVFHKQCLLPLCLLTQKKADVNPFAVASATGVHRGSAALAMFTIIALEDLIKKHLLKWKQKVADRYEMTFYYLHTICLHRQSMMPTTRIGRFRTPKEFDRAMNSWFGRKPVIQRF